MRRKNDEGSYGVPNFFSTILVKGVNPWVNNPKGKNFWCFKRWNKNDRRNDDILKNCFTFFSWWRKVFGHSNEWLHQRPNKMQMQQWMLVSIKSIKFSQIMQMVCGQCIGFEVRIFNGFMKRGSLHWIQAYPVYSSSRNVEL